MLNIRAKVLVLASLFLVAILVFAPPLFKTDTADASVAQGSEYQATTTAANSVYGARTVGGLIKTGRGMLGSVVITGANTGIINVYDATTTDVNLRTGNLATTSIHIASLPASLVAGTYVFDTAFSHGLYFDLVAGGSMPTSTVTYR